MTSKINKIAFYQTGIFQFALCLLSGFSLSSQSTISSSGGQSSGNAGKVDYTIGQIGYTNYSNASGRINEGVQQPFEILVLHSENLIESETPTVYPNPSFEKVFIDFKNVEKDAFYEIIDLDGKIQMTDKINDIKTEIPLNTINEKIYILKVYASKNKFVIFKLLKL